MDPTWNMVQADDASAFVWMDSYVYHYAGTGRRYSVVPVINWRYLAPQGAAARPAKPAVRWRMFQFLLSVPVLGPRMPFLYRWLSLPARYLWAWFSLPIKVKRLLDQVTEVNHMLKGLYLRQGERARGERPRPPDPRP